MSLIMVLVQVDAVLARDFNAIEKNNRVPNVIVDTHFYEQI